MRIFTPSSVLRITLLVLFGTLVWTFHGATFLNFNSRHGFRFKNWWKLLPKDESFYRITTKTTELIHRDSFSSILSGDFADLARRCDQSEQPNSRPFALCSVLNAVRTTTKIRFPSASLGSSQKVHLSPSECLDREGRWSPYADRESQIDLGQAQAAAEPAANGSRSGQIAIVVRAWDDCGWDSDAVNNIRALVSETALSSASYRVHILLHVRDEDLAKSHAGRETELLNVLRVPKELHGMTSTWSYLDTKEAYPDVGAYESVRSILQCDQ